MVQYDAFGPEKVIEVYNAKVGMRGVVIIDNTALGPGKGGIRMTPTVSTEEVFRLARTMTWKNAMAELPFGGAKSGIIFDPKQHSALKKKEIVEAFAQALKPVCPSLYVAAPDINTAEEEMRWFSDALGSRQACTGKPSNMGGIPHELGSTGFGVAHSAKTAIEYLKWDLKNVTFSVEGFGNVGWFAAKFLCEWGAKLVAVSDSKGVAYLRSGFDFDRLAEVKKKEGSVTNYPGCTVMPPQQILDVECDMLVTAAIPDLVKPADVPRIKAKLIVEGSNIPMTLEVERQLASAGKVIVPDFVANAGGVISSYVEYTGGRPEQMFKLVEKKVVTNTKLVMERSEKELRLPRETAMKIAQERVLSACKTCGVP